MSVVPEIMSFDKKYAQKTDKKKHEITEIREKRISRLLEISVIWRFWQSGISEIP